MPETTANVEPKEPVQVLVVDDEAGIRELIVSFVKQAGHNCRAVSSAEEALDALRDNPVDVAIVDIVLPAMDGLDLTTLVKKQYDTDVILVTGYSADYSYEDGIGRGASDFIFKPVRSEELILRLKRVLRERDLARERVEMLKNLRRLAITDGLTQIYNSRHFYDQLELEIGRSKRYGRTLSLLLLDIDHFKSYNDHHGHLAGDNVLLRIGQIIKSCLRNIDSAYRYGGEEFTVILPETRGAEALNVAERIRRAVEAERFGSEPAPAGRVTVSVGATEYRAKESMQDFVQRADQAMYQSKEKGRNTTSGLFEEDAS
jgi:diguanylate cyclase (GGDEF)-like protein